MNISRAWAMPNKQTFSIKPISEFIERWKHETPGIWIDPFGGQNKYAEFKNDLNPDIDADSHLDAIEFLRSISKHDGINIFFDPPYSPRQISECYHSVGIKTNIHTTQSSWYSNIKDEIAQLVSTGGIVISASWNSNGIGKNRGFEIEEIMIVAHGGWHNDTIVVAERKV